MDFLEVCGLRRSIRIFDRKKPVDRVKIILFIGTSCAACLLACIQVLDIGSADANRGVQKEFEAANVAAIDLLRPWHVAIVANLHLAGRTLPRHRRRAPTENKYDHCGLKSRGEPVKA